MTVDVGHIAARLDALFDQSGFDKFDRHYDQAERKSRDPVTAKLAGDYDHRALDAYDKRLSEIRATTARREDFKARLGADYNATAFREYERSLRTAKRDTDEQVHAVGRLRTAFGSLYARGGALLAASGAIYGVSRAVSAVVEQTVGFDRGMRNVNSIAQLSEKQLKSLSGQVLDLAGETAQAPQTLAEGLYDLVSSGFDADEAMKVLRSSAKAATAGLTDTATSTKAVAAVLNAYHEGAGQASKVSDTLFQTVNRGVVSFEELSNTIGDVLPFASSLHVDLSQVGAATATMTKEGINSAETMTRLKGVLETFIKPSEAMNTAIKATGYESGEALVKAKGLQGALEAVRGTTDGSKEALAKLFPNVRALGGALALTGGNAKTAHGDLKAFGKVAGATDKALSEQSKSITYQWNRLKSQASALAIEVGSKLLPAASDALKATSKFVDQFERGRGAGGKFRNTLEDIWDVTKRVGGAIGDVGGFLKDHIGLVKAAAEAWVAYKVAAKGAAAISGGRALLGALTGAAGGRAARGAAGAGAGGALLGGPAGIAAGAGIALLLHGLDNKLSRSIHAGAAADTVAGNLAGADPREIDRISKAMDVLQSKVLLSDKAWGRYQKTLRSVGVSDDASQQDLDAITRRFDKLRPALQRAADALTRLFGRKTRISAGDILDPNAAEQVASSLQYLKRTGANNIDDLRERLKFNMREIRKAFREGSAGSRAAMIENFGAGIKAVRRGMRDGSISVKDGMKEIRQISRQQMGFTRDNLADLSDDGKRKLALNFRHAADAVRDQMRRSGKVTKSGMRQVRSLLSQELQLYGFSIHEAKNITAGHSYIGGPEEGTAGRQRGGRVKRARGGWIGGRGQVGPDEVYIAPNAVAARGEFHAAGSGGYDAVINRHQAPVAEAFMRAFGGPFRDLDELARLGGGIDQVGYLDAVMAPIGGLDALFAAIQRPHMHATGGRLRRFAYGGVTPAIARLISRLDAMGFHHGATTDHSKYTSSGNVSNHYVGEAVDYGDASNNMRRLWSVVFPQRQQFAELFGPSYLVPKPTLMHHGVGFSDPGLQAEHNDHIHMALTGGANAAVSGSIAAAWKAIKAPKITGGGTVGRVVQGALGLAAKAANRVGQNAADSSTGGVGASGSIGPSALRALIARALRITGHYSPANVAGVYDRVMFESTGNPRAINLWDSNAKAGHPSKGLLQTIDSTFQSYRLPGLPNNIYNPLANLVAGIRYMFARYGHVMGNTGAGYQGGGRLAGAIAGARSNATRIGHRQHEQQHTSKVNRFSDRINAVLHAIPSGDARYVQGLQDRYDSFEERWQADDSDFIVLGDVNHPAHVNQKKINERIGQLNRLISLRQQIIAALQRVADSIRLRISTLKAAIHRLDHLVKRSHGKVRTGYRKLRNRYRGRLFDLGTERIQAVTAVSTARDDLGALRDEREGWRTGTTAGDIIGSLSPEEGGPALPGSDLGDLGDIGGDIGSTGPDTTEPETTEPTETPPTPEEIAAAAAQQLSSFQSGLQDLYGTFGRNYRLPTAPTPGSQYETPEFFGAGSGPTDQMFAGGGRGVRVGQITNVYPTPPPDPHTWSRNLEFELSAVG